MDLVPSFVSGYLPGLGILYNKEDKKHMGETLGHEIGHSVLKHQLTREPWEQFMQELGAWEYPLSRGADFDKRFIRQRLSGYTGPIFKAYGVEQGKEAIGMIDGLLERYP